MNFELDKKYIVEVTKKGIIPREEFLEERHINKDHIDDYLEFLTDEEKAIVINNVLNKLKTEIEQLPTKTRTNWDGCCPDIDYPEIEYVDVTKNKLLSIINKYRGEV